MRAVGSVLGAGGRRRRVADAHRRRQVHDAEPGPRLGARRARRQRRARRRQRRRARSARGAVAVERRSRSTRGDRSRSTCRDRARAPPRWRRPRADVLGAGVVVCCGRGSTRRHSTVRVARRATAAWPRRPSSLKVTRRPSSVPLATTKTSMVSPRRASTARAVRAVPATRPSSHGCPRTRQTGAAQRRRRRRRGTRETAARICRTTARAGSSFRRAARGATRSAWCRSGTSGRPR